MGIGRGWLIVFWLVGRGVKGGAGERGGPSKDLEKVLVGLACTSRQQVRVENLPTGNKGSWGGAEEERGWSPQRGLKDWVMV